ncbi:MAG: sigma-70 family RNA polymerase sigma factor [Chloroflexi bacterium]|nr:sigma-70 family RNA polymerase sigma factor [Chloroflexota bacterium]
MIEVTDVPSTKETFGRLYDEYVQKVFRYIHYKVNDSPLAEDLTSAVFEKALLNFSKYDKDKAAFSTWIFTIANTMVIDHFRVHGKRQNAPLEAAATMPATGLLPEEEMEKQGEQECLKICLSRLPEQDQEIIRLKFGAEINNRQIAKMVKLSDVNVGTRLYRAMGKLRECLRELENA